MKEQGLHACIVPIFSFSIKFQQRILVGEVRLVLKFAGNKRLKIAKVILKKNKGERFDLNICVATRNIHMNVLIFFSRTHGSIMPPALSGLAMAMSPALANGV